MHRVGLLLNQLMQIILKSFQILGTLFNLSGKHLGRRLEVFAHAVALLVDKAFEKGLLAGGFFVEFIDSLA
jgi:hypothetical protein